MTFFNPLFDPLVVLMGMHDSCLPLWPEQMAGEYDMGS